MKRNLKSKKRRFVFFALIFVLAFIFIFGFGIYGLGWTGRYSYFVSRVIPYPAVLVNWHPTPFYIYIDDLEALEKYSLYQKNNSNVPFEIQPSGVLRDNLANKLIEEKIISLFAKSKGIIVEEGEKDAEWSKIASGVASSSEISNFLLEAYGWDGEKFRQRVLEPFLLREKVKNFLTHELRSEEENLKQRAMGVYLASQSGTDFESLVKKYSEDTSSVGKGGDLGYFSRGTMDPYFEEAVFSMEIGQISKPVKTSYGYHVIKLEDLLYNDQGIATQARVRHVLIKGFVFDRWLDNQKEQMSVYRLVF